MTLREQILGGLVVAAMAGVAVWSYASMAESAAGARDQVARASAAEGLAKQIADLREHSGSPAAMGGVVETSRLITESAEAAGCGKSVVRIEPEAPRAIGESGRWHEAPMRVELANVTMGEGLEFLRAVEAGNPQVRATRVRWTAPSSTQPGAEGELWDGEIVFSQVVAGAR